MGEIIKISEMDNLIIREPFEFRWAPWDSVHFVQMTKESSKKFEKRRREQHRQGKSGEGQIPSHFVLKGGMAFTIQTLFRERKNENSMREIYFLAGLIDCVINQVNPILRTDLIRDVFNRINESKRRYALNWYGPLDQVLFPIDSHLYDISTYHAMIRQAGSLKELYTTIKEETEEMFLILSKEYTFYCPGKRELY